MSSGRVVASRGRVRWLLLGVALTLVSTVELGWGRTTDWRRAAGVDRIAAAEGGSLRPDARVAGRNAAPGPAADAGEPAVEWLGHAGFWLRWGDLDLVLDPNLSERCTVAPRRWSAAELRDIVARRTSIDAVFISHGHFDHLDLPTLRSLPRIDRLVVPTGAGRYVAGLDVAIWEVAPGWPLDSEPALRLGDLEVFVVPAAHHGNRLHPLRSEELAVGYVLRRGDTTLYFAGDTGDGAHVDQIASAFDIDWALLPIGAYLPRWPLARVHLDPGDAVAVAQRLGAGTVVPMHFGTYRLSLDRTSWALPAFARAADRAGLRWRMPVPLDGSASAASSALPSAPSAPSAEGATS